MNNNKQEYTSPLAVNNQVYFCGVPFRMDSYSGCGHGCKYCFVRAAELTSASRKARGNSLLLADESAVKRDLVTALDTSYSREAIEIEWLRRGVPIHWGGMSDPFQPCEGRYHISKKWMDYLSWYKYPTVISTKGTMLMEPEYFKALKEGNYAVQVSLISDNEEFIKALEPGAPPPSERMSMLAKLAEAGIWTAVRIQPVITSSIVERGLPEYIKKLASVGVKHVLAEGYKVPLRAEREMKAIWELCPETRNDYSYNDNSTEGFEALLPTWRKWQYVKILRQLCHEYGMTFGAADNDLRDMGDTICCCGIDNLKGFENFWRYQASQAAFIAKEKGFVVLDDMQQFWHGEKTLSWHNDGIRFASWAVNGTSGSSPKFAVDFMWNKGGAMSPECIYSMRRGTKDSKLVYNYANPVSELERKQVSQTSF